MFSSLKKLKSSFILSSSIDFMGEDTFRPIVFVLSSKMVSSLSLEIDLSMFDYAKDSSS